MRNLKVFNSPIKYIDEKILKSLTRSGRLTAYTQSLQFKSNVIGGGQDSNALKDVDAVDTKSGPLLSHVSVMIAIIAVFLSLSSFTIPKKIFLGLEMMAYVIIALCCLRCIHVEEIGSGNIPYTEEQHKKPMKTALLTEAALKMHILRFANGFAMLLTAFMLITTPLLFLF